MLCVCVRVGWVGGGCGGGGCIPQYLLLLMWFGDSGFADDLAGVDLVIGETEQLVASCKSSLQHSKYNTVINNIVVISLSTFKSVSSQTDKTQSVTELCVLGCRMTVSDNER